MTEWEQVYSLPMSGEVGYARRWYFLTALECIDVNITDDT